MTDRAIIYTENLFDLIYGVEYKYGAEVMVVSTNIPLTEEEIKFINSYGFYTVQERTCGGIYTNVKVYKA